MRTVTIEILNDKVISLLKHLEELDIIRLHKDELETYSPEKMKQLQGSMSKQSREEIDKQFNELRAEWDRDEI